MKVLFAASECVPFVKTGGLADVAGALPKRLRDLGVDVRVMLPMYSAIEPKWREQMEHELFFYVNLGWRRQYVGIEKLVYEGITFYFIDNEQYFGRNYIYGYGADEGERFAYFCRAVLESLPLIGFVPDVIHCNDWQTGLIPPMLDIQYRKLEQYKDVKTVFTIHNLKYQGLFQIDDIEEMVSLGELAYTADSLEFYGMCSFIKGGIVFADHITTVSPTYAQEIQTAYYGERLDGLLRARASSLTGILNGIDTDEYNPRPTSPSPSTTLPIPLRKRRGTRSPSSASSACTKTPTRPSSPWSRASTPRRALTWSSACLRRSCPPARRWSCWAWARASMKTSSTGRSGSTPASSRPPSR